MLFIGCYSFLWIECLSTQEDSFSLGSAETTNVQVALGTVGIISVAAPDVWAKSEIVKCG